MLFFPTIFLLFLYFKIARVHIKMEKQTFLIKTLHFFVFLSAVLIYEYGFHYINPYAVISVSFIFFVITALMVTAVQVGIFIDGKPLIGIEKVYKNFMPIIGISVILLAILMLKIIL